MAIAACELVADDLAVDYTAGVGIVDGVRPFAKIATAHFLGGHGEQRLGRCANGAVALEVGEEERTLSGGPKARELQRSADVCAEIVFPILGLACRPPLPRVQGLIAVVFVAAAVERVSTFLGAGHYDRGA